MYLSYSIRPSRGNHVILKVDPKQCCYCSLHLYKNIVHTSHYTTYTVHWKMGHYDTCQYNIVIVLVPHSKCMHIIVWVIPLWRWKNCNSRMNDFACKYVWQKVGRRTGCGTTSSCSRHYLLDTSVNGKSSSRSNCWAEQRLHINISIAATYICIAIV